MLTLHATIQRARALQDTASVKAHAIQTLDLAVRDRPVGAWAPDDDVVAGLRAPRKRLPRASSAEPVEAFAQLEVALLRRHGAQLALQVGPEARVFEIGGSDLATTRGLLGALERPSSYVAVDTHDRSSLGLRHAFPQLDVQTLHADYTHHFELPAPQHEWRRTLAFVGGATLGTFEPGEARTVLALLARAAGPDRLLLVGADATRDPEIHAQSYGDDGLTRSMLAELNRARGATFDLDGYDHRATWNAEASRVELHLVSKRRQIVRLAGTPIVVSAGEPIVAQYCYKHTPVAMQALLGAAGWKPRQVFTATHMPYRLWLCEPSRE